MATTLEQVMTSMGITGDYQTETIRPYYEEVIGFLVDAGVQEDKITAGLVTRGVVDLWNYGGGDGKLSPYFYQRAAQLSYKR